MSYIRCGHHLTWFGCESDLYVYHNGDGIEDYGGSGHMPSVIEHIGNMIYRETGDYEYATLMVIQLADNCGCLDMLRQYVPKLEFEYEREYYLEAILTIKKMLPIYKHRKECYYDKSKSV